jgi:proline iminopeptidase
MPAARAWSIWEGATSKLLPDAAFAAAFGADDKALAFARIECHYFVNGGFFEVEDQLLRDAARLASIPTTIVQGRYDMVCPMRSAHELAARMPHADFVVVPDAGHSAFEPGISRALVAATDKYALL